MVDGYSAGTLTPDESSRPLVSDGEGLPVESVGEAKYTAGGLGERRARDPRTTSSGWRQPLFWDSPVGNGDKSELARDLAEGRGNHR